MFYDVCVFCAYGHGKVLNLFPDVLFDAWIVIAYMLVVVFEDYVSAFIVNFVGIGEFLQDFPYSWGGDVGVKVHGADCYFVDPCNVYVLIGEEVDE